MTVSHEDPATYGTLDQLEDGRWQLRFTRVLRHPQERVWRAITEPEHLSHWFPTTIEGERVAGAPLRFSFPQNQAEPFAGELLAVEAPHLLELRWGPDVIRIELAAHEDGTLLTLLDTLEERGKAARDGAGWHTCLDALSAHLREEPDARQAMGGWSDVRPVYIERFGPEASTIGPPEGF
jgi:uncharacterized protein YndB with AHSA1/START domain